MRPKNYVFKKGFGSIVERNLNVSAYYSIGMLGMFVGANSTIAKFGGLSFANLKCKVVEMCTKYFNSKTRNILTKSPF